MVALPLYAVALPLYDGARWLADPDDLMIQHWAEKGLITKDNQIPDADTKSDTRDVARWANEFSDRDLSVRGRAEAWEVPRDEIHLLHPIGQAKGSVITGQEKCRPLKNTLRVVYKARWRGLECAGKVLQQHFSPDSNGYRNMIHEIQVISHLRHPNLVLFLGACTRSESLITLTEFMPMGSLKERYDGMRQTIGAPWKPLRSRVLKWMTDLTRAMCYLHNCTIPIVHRNLKPSNLLLCEHDHLKISDFELCTTLHKARQVDKTMRLTAGRQHDVHTCYTAPEVVHGESDYDCSADIFSMAMIFWFMRMGEAPFANEDPRIIFNTRGLRPDMQAVPWACAEDLVRQMWSEAPAKRPSACLVLATLQALRMNEPQSSAWHFDVGDGTCEPEGCNVACHALRTCVVM